MRWFSAIRNLLLAAATVSAGWAQIATPTITSLQSSSTIVGNGFFTHGPAITSGTPLSPETTGGILLLINGAFNVDGVTSVTWRNTSTNAVTVIPRASAVSIGGAQLIVTIPPALFQTPVASAVPVTVTVQEGATNSNAATFTINPPLRAVQPFMPTGTINVAYSADLSTGGTSPFAGVTTPATLPPGLFGPDGGVTLSGTPTQTGVFSFQTSAGDDWGYTAAGNVILEIVDVPTVTAVAPNFSIAGAGPVTVTVSGTNFVGPVTVASSPQQIPSSLAQWRSGNVATTLATTIVNSTRLTATVPAGLLTTPGQFGIQVTNPDGSLSNSVPYTVIPPLVITTAALSGGTSGSQYSFTLSGRGGVPPYVWAASGLPTGLALNPTTGVIGGTLLAGGTFTVTVVLTDAARNSTSAQFQIAVGPPPLTITAGGLPQGTVGVAYLTFIGASGGTNSYTFSLGSGTLPDGLTISPGGAIAGTPKTPGQYSFFVVVTDSAGANASGDFRLTIVPAPLNITGGPTGPVNAGTPINITFSGTGGVPPYRLSPSTAMPPGTVFSNGTLSGTPTTAGSFDFRITIGDTTGAVFTKSFTLTVVVTPLALSGSLGSGKAGVAYSGQISASGGTPPYTYSGTGLPDGLTLSAAGGISGTPGTAGQFTLTATVTDSTGAKATGTFPITIAPADLSIVTASLPDGVVGAGYSAGLTASGGVPPYTWTVTGLPGGVTATTTGAISGTPAAAGKFTVSATVTDAAAASATKSYTLTIAPAPLVITTASAPNGTVGTAYAASFAATGGTPPYTFSAAGLPAGLSISAAGAISGTPTAPGNSTIVVTVKDAAGTSTSKNFPVTIGLPATPPLNFAGITATSNPLQQPRLQVSLGSPFPLDVIVTLTLTFAPDSGADDPTIQFSGGGRTARITIPAGATNGLTDVGVQTGSVAGLITITAQLQAGGRDVTPSPAPVRTIRIAPGPPVVVTGSLTAVRNSTGFTVTLTGYVTDRELTQAIFTFTGAAGSNLQTTTLTIPIDTLFAQYFSGAGSTPFGSQFTYTQTFTVTGSTQAIVSVTVTLVNKLGQSSPLSATLN